MTIAHLKKFSSKFLGSIRRKEEEAACSDMIKTMQVKVSDRNQRIDSLSGGNQQKVIIRALGHDGTENPDSGRADQRH